ncbi:MAG: thiosulfate oxidation carrier complex protein SoxZ [Methylobacillus sp.]|jgi:sulfur-oxidizing protein SoxZ|nr:thiosulfate oxidation carrier complex protein SoxZ [Methylobacillus sp.]
MTTMKLRARLKNGITEIKALIPHPMETGRRLDDAGNTVPAHFIRQITLARNDQTVLEAQWGTGISKDPYLTFRLRNGAAGDRITLRWMDNLGMTDAVESIVEAD